MNARLLNRIISMLLVSSWFLLASTGVNAQVIEALSNLFNPSIPKAVERGLAPGGDLAMEIQKLGDVSVSTMTEARAVVKATKALPLNPDARKTEAYSSAVFKVADLFEAVDNSSVAATHLQNKGIPELIRIYDALVQESSDEAAQDALRVLPVLAMYYTAEGTDRVIDGVKRQLNGESYQWSRTFSCYDSQHPESVRFYREMSEHLPSGNIAMALLRQSNQRALEDSNFKHPFNSEDGVDLLKQWLGDEAAEMASDAVSAIEYIDMPQQGELFSIASQHPDKSIRLKATYGQAQLGEPAAFEQLTKFCLDVDISKAAQEHLKELEAAELIPEEASEPEFAAKAEFSAWIVEPYELGKAPSEMHIVDQRELKWFDDETPRLFTIIEYVAKSDDPLEHDTRGVGLVGSTTKSFFGEAMRFFPPEDIYALHYSWEARNRVLIEDIEETPLSDEQQAAYRSQWNGEELEEVQFLDAWKFDSELSYPQESIACASAKIDGQEGFVVFDGPRSHWYPASQFHPEVHYWHIWQIHAGRVLLGFDLNVERTFTPMPEAKFPPELVVGEYQKWLQELKTGSTDRQVELLTELSPLERHFSEYIDALVETKMAERNQAVEQTFEAFLEAARELPKTSSDEALDIFSVIGSAFEAYADAVNDEPEKLKALIVDFESRWDYGYGRSQLGKIAFHAGQREIAQRLLEKQIDLEEPSRHRGEGSDILAEIWHSQGKTPEAKEMLIQAIKQCIEDAAQADYEDDEAQADAQRHLDTYRRLFPDSAQAELEQAGLATPIEQLIDAEKKAEHSAAS